MWNPPSRPLTTWTSVGSCCMTFDRSRKERSGRYIAPAVHPPLCAALLWRRTASHAQAVALKNRPCSFLPLPLAPSINAYASFELEDSHVHASPNTPFRMGAVRARDHIVPGSRGRCDRASELLALPLSKHVKLKVAVAWRAKVGRTWFPPTGWPHRSVAGLVPCDCRRLRMEEVKGASGPPSNIRFCSTPPTLFEKERKKKEKPRHPQCSIHENSLLVQETETWGRVVSVPAAALLQYESRCC